MTFSAPAWLALLALAPLIVTLHLRRPRELPVSSLFLWRRLRASTEEAESGRGAKVDVPLILQLLALLTLTLTLAGPRFGATSDVQHAVYVFGAAAGAADEAEVAQAQEAWMQRVREETRALPGSVSVTVVEASGAPRFHAVRERASASVAPSFRPEPSGARPNWTAAFQALRDLHVDGERVVVTVFTAPSEEQRVEQAFSSMGLPDAALVTVLEPVGSVAAEIVGATVTRDADSGDLVLDVEVVGRSAGETVTVEVSAKRAGSEGFEVVETSEVAVPEDRPADLSFTLRAGDLTELRLTASAAGQDAGESLALPVPQRPRVLVVGPVSQELGRALRSVPDVDVYVAERMPADQRDYVLVVITDPSVAEVPEVSTLWLGAYPGGRSGLTQVLEPEVSGWDDTHRLGAGGWFGLRVRSALAGPVLDGASVVLASGELPLIQARATDRGYQVVVAFDPGASNWPTLATFPVFLSEVVDMVAPAERRGRYTACVAGELCRLGAWALDLKTPLRLPLGGSWPDAAAMVPVSDPFASAYWPLGGAELDLYPRSAGLYGGAEPLVVVASPRLPAATSDPDAEPRSAAAIPARELTTWLLLVTAGALVLNVLLVWRRRLKHLRSRGPGALLLTALSLLGVVAALVELPFPTRAPPGRVVTVVDGSVSEAEGARQLTVTWRDSGTEASGVPGVTTGSYRRALQVAAGLASGGEVRVVAPPGAGPSPAEVAAIAQSGELVGASLVVERVGAAATGTLGVVGMEVPDKVAVGAPTELLLTLRADQSAVWRLTVSLGERVVLDADLEVSPGTNTLRVPFNAAAAGSHELVVTVASEDVEFSDEIRRGLIVDAAPRVLVIGSDAVAAEHLAAALRLQGLDAASDAPLNMPWNAAGWSGWDVAVLHDLPAHSLHSLQIDLLEDWVFKAGGGLVILGGDASFGPGGYLRTPLDKLSPLSSQVPREIPEVTMIFVIDRSGSMQQAVAGSTRMGIAKEATVSAIELLGPGSRVGIVVYDSEAHVLVPLTPVEERDRIAEAVESVRANGGTSLYPALVAAADMLEGVESAAVHVVVLTDGMSESGEFRSVIRRLKEHGATISFVGIGSGADRIQLRDLSSIAGGALHVTDDVRALPSILAQEAMLGSEDLIHRVTVAVTPGSGDWVTPLPATGLVGGYVRTEAKPGASVHFWTFEDEPAPLLASWRYGLGRVVAFTSHAIGEWAGGWVAPADFASTWTEVVRWAGATEALPSATRVVANASGNRVDVDVLVDPRPETEVEPPFTVFLRGSEAADRGVSGGTAAVGPHRHTVSLLAPAPGEYVLEVEDAAGRTVSTGSVLVSGGFVEDPGRSRTLEVLAAWTAVAEGADEPAVGQGLAWAKQRVPWALTALVCFLVMLLVTYGRPRWEDLTWALGLAGEVSPRAKVSSA